MYQAFDKFLARNTWHTMHPIDEKVFFLCLSTVVMDSKFSPEAMGEYMLQKTRPPALGDTEHPFAYCC